jgi:hypothetical protein
MSSLIIDLLANLSYLEKEKGMRLVNELKRSLNGFLHWDKRRMDCFVKVLVALMMVQTVNLKKTSLRNVWTGSS